MKLNELFEMIEQANKVNQLIDEKTITVEIRYNSYESYREFKSFTEFEKWVNKKENCSRYADRIINEVLNADYIQTKTYKQTKVDKHYFRADWEIFGVMVEKATVHIYYK